MSISRAAPEVSGGNQARLWRRLAGWPKHPLEKPTDDGHMLYGLSIKNLARK